MKRKIAVLASGSGSNAENIIRYFSESDIIEVSLVLTNRKDAYVLERAARHGVPGVLFSKEAWATGTEVLELLQKQGVEFLALAGFLLKVPDVLLHAYPDRIINIHPSLLPKYGGRGMYGDHVHQAVVAAGERETGITIHYINERYDEGAIIFQASCPVLPTDTPEGVAAKVHALEYEHFPSVIEACVRRAVGEAL